MKKKRKLSKKKGKKDKTKKQRKTQIITNCYGRE